MDVGDVVFRGLPCAVRPTERGMAQRGDPHCPLQPIVGLVRGSGRRRAPPQVRRALAEPGFEQVLDVASPSVDVEADKALGMLRDQRAAEPRDSGEVVWRPGGSGAVGTVWIAGTRGVADYAPRDAERELPQTGQAPGSTDVGPDR